MGSSCSSQLEELKTKNKKLENRIALYEKGITDKSIHASQTNFGLLTIANEDNTECGCNSSGSLFGVMEIVAVLMAVLFVLVWLCREIHHLQEKHEGKKEEQIAIGGRNKDGKSCW